MDTPKINSKNFSLTNVLLLLGSALALIAYFSKLEGYNFVNYFNSDTMYLPSVYTDLFIDQTSMTRFHFNPAPNFFPDMLFFFVLFFVCGHNIVVTFFCYSVIQYFLILYLFTRLFKIIFPGASNRYFSVIYLTLVLVILQSFFFKHDLLVTFIILSNSFHTGSFIMALVSLIITVKYYKDPKLWRIILLFVIGLLSVISDQLYVILFSAPASAACFFSIRNKLKQSLVLLGLNILVVVLGMWVFSLITESLLLVDQNHIQLTWEAMKASYKEFVHLIKLYLKSFDFRTISLCIFLITLVPLVFILFKSKKEQNFTLNYFILFTLVFSVVVGLSPVLCGNFIDPSCQRYNIFPLYVSSLNLAVVAYFIFKEGIVTRISSYVGLLLSLELIFMGLSQINKKGLKGYFNYYPEVARRVDELAEKEGLLCGVADYWLTKHITMFSKKGVKVYTVYTDLAIYPHVINDAWYYDNGNKFNFVILNLFPDTTRFKKSVLWHKMLVDEKKLKLVKTNVFRYTRENNGRVVND